jgi:molybdenum cofactor biosynthesis protein B
MVDFQSRTTRYDGQDEDEDEAEPSTEDSGPDPETDEDAASPTETETPAEMAYAVVTVSAEHTITDDPPGEAVAEALESESAPVVAREVVDPDVEGVRDVVRGLTGREDVAAVVTVGGVGLGPADVTVEALAPLFDRSMPGFGELFRVISHDQEGTAIVRTRATAGLVGAVPVFCLPGKRSAAGRAAQQLVAAEAENVVREAAGER